MTTTPQAVSGEPLWTPDVARRTASVLERVRRVVPEIEWPVHAPFVDAIDEWKRNGTPSCSPTTTKRRRYSTG